ncbi:MAG: hypothetical protein SV375_18810, partial [Thermodesulfobacteriota bacterium]|nr:hypothetical protein [Thermodesulfobacteriota bacterium]
PAWLYRDFILGYFDKKVSIAQKRYCRFVNGIVNEKYDNPSDEVVNSTLLGSPNFITFIRDRYLSGKKPDKDLPALKELSDKASLKDIFDEVEAVFGKEVVLGRNIKMFLCQRYTGEKLKLIGTYIGIGESGVSQACRRVKHKIKNDKKLERKTAKIENKLNLSTMKI